jgi:hypothetical protein
MQRIKASNLNRGLVGAWCPSVAGNGLLLPDLSGYGNHGTLTNMDASDWVGTDRGRALDFDGINDEVIVSRNANYQFAHNVPFSILLWIVLRGNSDGPILAYAKASGFVGYYISRFSNKILADYFPGGVFQGRYSVTISTNTLYCCVMTRDGTATQAGHRLYLNGVEDTGNRGGEAATITAGIDYSNAQLALGNRLGVGFNNQIAFEARIYNRALSPSEIKQLYEGGPGYGLRQERKRSRFQVQGFNAGRFRRQQLIGSGVY